MRRAWMVGASALVLAGCAGTAGTSSSPGAATGSAAPGAADMSAYVQCLSEHGVELPTGGPMSGTRPEGAPSGRPTDMPSAMPTDLPSAMPGGGPEGQPRGQMAAPPGVDDATWQAAQDACSELAPTGRDPQDGTAPPGRHGPAGRGCRLPRRVLDLHGRPRRHGTCLRPPGRPRPRRSGRGCGARDLRRAAPRPGDRIVRASQPGPLPRARQSCWRHRTPPSWTIPSRSFRAGASSRRCRPARAPPRG